MSSAPPRVQPADLTHTPPLVQLAHMTTTTRQLIVTLALAATLTACGASAAVQATDTTTAAITATSTVATPPTAEAPSTTIPAAAAHAKAQADAATAATASSVAVRTARSPGDPFGDGFFVVGSSLPELNIATGLWRSDGPAGCTWASTADSGHVPTPGAPSIQFVQIDAGSSFNSGGCGEWIKVG